MPVDLRKVNAVHLHYSASSRLSPELERACEGLFGEPLLSDAQVLVERLGKKRRRQVHQMLLVRDGDNLLLEGDIRVIGEEAVEATAVKPLQVLRVFGKATRREIGIGVTCQFVYRSRSHKLLFPLPIPLQTESGLGFDEIGGVRLIKREGEKVEHQVIVDQAGGEYFSVTAMVHTHAPFGLELPEALLEQAGQIAQGVVRVRETEAGST